MSLQGLAQLRTHRRGMWLSGSWMGSEEHQLCFSGNNCTLGRVGSLLCPSHHTAAGPGVNKHMKSVIHPCAEVAGSTHHTVSFSLSQVKGFRESRKLILGPMRLCPTVMLQLPLVEAHTVDRDGNKHLLEEGTDAADLWTQSFPGSSV